MNRLSQSMRTIFTRHLLQIEHTPVQPILQPDSH
jgi:hypothetical protein